MQIPPLGAPLAKAPTFLRADVVFAIRYEVPCTWRTFWSAAYASTSSSATAAWQQRRKSSTSCVPSSAGDDKKVKEELDLYAARVAAMREAESTSTDAEASAKIEAVTPVAPRVKL